jgi:hypothetical protein
LAVVVPFPVHAASASAVTAVTPTRAMPLMFTLFPCRAPGTRPFPPRVFARRALFLSQRAVKFRHTRDGLRME